MSGANSNPSDLSLGTDDEAPPLTKWRSLTGNLVWSLVPRVTTGVGVTYHSALFRGDNNENDDAGTTPTRVLSDESNDIVEGHFKVSVSY